MSVLGGFSRYRIVIKLATLFGRDNCSPPRSVDHVKGTSPRHEPKEPNMNRIETHKMNAKSLAEKAAEDIDLLQMMLAKIAAVETSDSAAFANIVDQTRNIAYGIAFELDAAVRHANTAVSIADLDAAVNA